MILIVTFYQFYPVTLLFKENVIMDVRSRGHLMKYQKLDGPISRPFLSLFLHEIIYGKND